MDNLMKCLYDFVLERRMGDVVSDPEYREASHTLEMQMKKVEAGMNEEQGIELRVLLESVSAQNSIESEHLFHAALGLARELSALAG